MFLDGSGMGRKKLRPDYDTEKVQWELIGITKDLYGMGYHYRQIARELGLSVSKVVKLLITGGEYSSDICQVINGLYSNGKSVSEIQKQLAVSRATVQSYLPYKKGVYNTKEISLNAERIKVYRKREKAVKELYADMCEEKLWNAFVKFQGYSFRTVSGQPFTYMLKRGRNGSYNRELKVNRSKECKSLGWGDVMLAFENALAMKGSYMELPKALGDIRDATYIYPILHRFGVIEGPDEVKMEYRRRVLGRTEDRKPKIVR